MNIAAIMIFSPVLPKVIRTIHFSQAGPKKNQEYSCRDGERAQQVSASTAAWDKYIGLS